MWDKKRESNGMCDNQNLNFDSVGHQTPFVQSMRFPPPDNSSNIQLFAEVTKKRKSMDTDVGHDDFSAGFLGNIGGRLGHPPQREYTSQHNVALTPLDSQMPFNHNSEQANPSNAESPYRAFQFYNTGSLTLETKEENIKKASFGGLQSFPVHTLHEISKNEDSEQLVCNNTIQYELSKFPSYYRHCSGLTEMSQVAPRLDGDEHNRIPSNPCLYPLSTPLNNMATCSSSLMVVNENFHSDMGDGHKFCKNGPFDISIGKAHPVQAPALSEGRVAYESYQNHDTMMRSESSNNHDVLRSDSNHKENTDPPKPLMPVHAESSFKERWLDHVSRGFKENLFQQDAESTSKNTCHQSGEESLLVSIDGLANRLVDPNDRQLINLEELNQSVSEKTSPLIVEKLWDGSLQLNTSTTVSAVAFFKSGEKAQDTKWPEHVEVKGKVRLQAFEKFIQELPRSRNRALMVISLCWKRGSPEAGLAGMKEVAKGYIQSQKVGFAQICPGLDLYVCPRNDTIITILAKHGFFKGMGAVEDNQDSLIGCVIWRRGHTSSNPVPKISEKKETQLPETSSPNTQVGNLKSKEEKALSPLKATLNNSKSIIGDSSMPYSSPLIQVQPPAAQKLESNSSQETMRRPDIPITQVVEPKELVAPVCSRPTMMLPGAQHQTNTHTNDGSQKFRNHSYVPRPELVASISSNFTFIGAQIPTPQNTVQRNAKPELAQPALTGPPPLPPEFQRIVQFNSEANKAPTEGMMNAEASFMPTEEPKETDRASEVQHKPGNLDDDDDGDLPEFDFASACGVPKAPVSTFRRSIHQKYQQIGSLKNENGFLGRSMNTYLGSNSTIPTRFGELNSEKKPTDAPSLSHQFPGKSDKGFLSSCISQKSTWDDDDDMPEWCPPDLEHLDEPTVNPSTRILPTVSKPISENAKELHLTPTQCSIATFRAPIQSHPSIQRQSFPGYRPRGFVPIDVRPPQRPHPRNSVRPQFKNFGGKYPASVSWQWKRE